MSPHKALLLLSLCFKVVVSVCVCLKQDEKRGEREKLKEAWETIRGVMIKQSLLTAVRETQSHSLGLLRRRSDEINSVP